MPSNIVTREWVLCSAAGLALFIACLALPALSPVILMICPFPQALLTYRRGVRAGTLSVLCVSSALFAAFLAVPSVIYVLSIGSVGILLGAAVRKFNGADALLAGIICSLCCKLAATYFLYRATGFNLLSPDPAGVEQTLLAVFESRMATLPGIDASAVRADISGRVRYILLLIPFNMILFASLEVFLSYTLSSKVHAARGGEAFFKLPPFGKWSFPKNILATLMVALVCGYVSQRNPDAYLLAQVSANLGTLAWTLFAVQGLAVAYYFMEARGFPKAVRVAIILLTPITQYLGSLFSIVGIIDMGFDLRKRARRKQP
jgi:uncharacterized protein YybS (DUF2232 family)